MKPCNKCGERKPLEMFYKHYSNSDGRQGSCKECVKKRSAQWRKDNPKPKKGRGGPRMVGFRLLPEGTGKCARCKEIKDKSEFYASNARKAGITAYCKPCYKEYEEERRARLGDERYFAAVRKWEEENRERINERRKLWAEDNRDRRRLNESRRRARKKSLPDTLTNDGVDYILENFEYQCAICADEYEHLDHFIPISSGHGGTTPGNIVPLCSDCNLSKHSNNPFEWSKKLTGSERERFYGLVRYLTDINGIATVEDYEAHVNQCFN